MKLVIHPGLHKTASTYLQHVLNYNHATLLQRGVYYQRQDGYPAHHKAAWQLLAGDSQPLVDMVQEAHAADCHTLIVSSEDLEGALWDDRPIAAIAAATAQSGVERTEWHVVLRDPGAAFASLFAQLQHHVYADAFQLFYDVMRRGFVHMAAPMPGAGTPYWYYCFDHAADLDRLRQRTGCRVIAHDFAAEAAFPGAQMLERLGILDAIETMPGDDARNARPDREEIIQGFVMRVCDAVTDPHDQKRITAGFLDCLESGLENIATYADLIGDRFGESHARALASDPDRQSPACDVSHRLDALAQLPATNSATPR